MEKTDKLCIDDIEVVRDLGYSRTKVLMCSFIIFLLDIVMYLGHGAMPATLTGIQDEMKLSNTDMGGLGSMVFFGIVLGSASGAYVFKKFEYRTTIWVSLLINGLFLFFFSQATEYWQLSISRFIAGFSQVFIIIYRPVFIDTFASRAQKPIFMAMILVSPPLGVVFGYLFTAILLQK